MYNTLKQTLTSDWHAMRIIRLVLSGIILVQAITFHDPMLALFGGVFMLMAVFNTGCCGSGGCGVNYSGKAVTTPNEKDKIDFEEIK
jgi:hypothetical protein